MSKLVLLCHILSLMTLFGVFTNGYARQKLLLTTLSNGIQFAMNKLV